jgi:Amt family ammonium transporter
VITCVVFNLIGSYILFKLISKIIPMRVTAQEEEMGLDLAEMGISAYPDYEVAHTS